MAARTRRLQQAVAVVNLSIVALVFTSVWPFPSGDFKVVLPSANDVEWEYAGGVVHIIAPYTIDNGWIYDVDDLTITYSVTNGTHSELAGDVITIGSIPAGQVRSDELDFEFDLLEQYSQGIDWMIFHEDMLFIHLEVTGISSDQLTLESSRDLRIIGPRWPWHNWSAIRPGPHRKRTQAVPRVGEPRAGIDHHAARQEFAFRSWLARFLYIAEAFRTNGDFSILNNALSRALVAEYLADGPE